MNEKTEDAAAKQLLQALAEIDRLLRDHATELRRSLVVTNAQASFRTVSYASGPVLEGYVDATFKNGISVCWCLDVSWNEHSWTIEATLDSKTGDRQRTIKELPMETASNLDGFLKTLKRVTRELLALKPDSSG